ncbi:MAG TPA: hypothetical protein GX724_02195 [Fibrobacter sp.]|nr:hypothetical protein [Fibrobacter sp.]
MGHIFFITPDSSCNLDEIAQWTLFWLLDHDMVTDTTLYTCSGLEQAYQALEKPLKNGDSPSLIVIDYPLNPNPEMIQFVNRLRECIPEAWIVEFIPKNMPLPPKKDDSLFWVSKPVSQESWVGILQHVCLQAASPQWSKAENPY